MLASNGGRVPIASLAVASDFPRLARVVSHAAASMGVPLDASNIIRAVLRRGGCDCVLDADNMHALIPDNAARLKRLVEYYFGDTNYPRDAYLQNLASEHEGGYIPLSQICAFRRMKVRSNAHPYTTLPPLLHL